MRRSPVVIRFLNATTQRTRDNLSRSRSACPKPKPAERCSGWLVEWLVGWLGVRGLVGPRRRAQSTPARMGACARNHTRVIARLCIIKRKNSKSCFLFVNLRSSFILVTQLTIHIELVRETYAMQRVLIFIDAARSDPTSFDGHMST
jgi:hypothetical protein